MSPKTVPQILEDPDFLELVRKKDRISSILTTIELVLYFGFIALIAYNKAYLAEKISAGSSITIGIPIAVGVIVFSWILTGVYVFWANGKYDPMVKAVKEKMER